MRSHGDTDTKGATRKSQPPIGAFRSSKDHSQTPATAFAPILHAFNGG